MQVSRERIIPRLPGDENAFRVSRPRLQRRLQPRPAVLPDYSLRASGVGTTGNRHADVRKVRRHHLDRSPEGRNEPYAHLPRLRRWLSGIRTPGSGTELPPRCFARTYSISRQGAVAFRAAHQRSLSFQSTRDCGKSLVLGPREANGGHSVRRSHKRFSTWHGGGGTPHLRGRRQMGDHLLHRGHHRRHRRFPEPLRRSEKIKRAQPTGARADERRSRRRE